MAKVGKPKYIETPEMFWQLFLDYKKQAKETPFLEHDYVGKDAESVYRNRERCLTIEGFELYCMDLDIINDLGDYFSNKNGKYSEFSTICSRVKKTIRRDQIEGGMAGIYNPSITQRLNGLVDKSQVQVSEQPLLPD